MDAYDGTMQFFIIDRTDPIIMTFRNLYPGLFEDLDARLPEDIARHIVYPIYLFNVQAEMLKRYHDVRAEVLYREDDVWDIAKERSLITRSLIGTDIVPYYTAIRSNEGGIELGLIVPYTMLNRQNLRGYLVGTHDTQLGPRLRLNKFGAESTILRNNAINYFN